MRILLVDDEEDIVDEMSRYLCRRGHSVVTAGCVASALQALERNGPFDVVLTDLNMPGGSGLDIVRACRQCAEPRPAAIMISGNAGAQDIACAYDEGALQVLGKPVMLRELLKLLSGIESDRTGGSASDAVRPESAVRSSI
ncbi:MAG: response regulator transcription factor [Alphaproteobacteria bacterium]|nr:response regulator transcription factor [Alphaproteobacteria bacterium]